MWSSLKNYSDGALLFLRVVFGSLCLYLYGWPALAGGVGRWKAMGSVMKHVGITFAPTFWGFMGAVAQSLGCLLLIIGFMFRPSALAIYFTVLVVVLTEVFRLHSFLGGLAADREMTTLAFFLLTLVFIGPGRFSVDKG